MSAQAERVEGRASGLSSGCRAWLPNGDGGQLDAGSAWAGLDPSLYVAYFVAYFVAAGLRLADEFVLEFDVGVQGRCCLIHSIVLERDSFTCVDE